MSIATRLIELEQIVRRNRLTVDGAEMTQGPNGTTLHIGQPATNNKWLQCSVDSATPTVIDVSEGWVSYRTQNIRASDGTDTITGFSTNGVHYACVELDFGNATATLKKLTVSGDEYIWLLTFGNTHSDQLQYYFLARVTVADSEISKIEQLYFGGWCIYENRIG